MTDYDVLVIGGGPAGYTAAGRAGANSLKTALIEANALGGICLNAGCIPTKTLLNTAKLYAKMLDSTAYGITLDNRPALDWLALQARKNEIVTKLQNGIRYQMLRHRVDVIEGYATFLDKQTVQAGDEQYSAKHIIVATGASPDMPTFAGADALQTTTDLLSVEALPEHLVLVGMSEIALGLACIFALIGIDVTIVDDSHNAVPDFDSELVDALIKDLPDNITLQLGQAIVSLENNTLILADGVTISGDMVVFTGQRKPNISNMNLDALSLDLSGGCINVDDIMRTNIPNIYAIGDVTGLSMWANTAQRMGEVVINGIVGVADRFNLAHIPTVIYSVPQLAMVGMTEQQARDAGYDVRVSRLPLNYNGRFLTEYHADSRAMCKIVVDKQTNVVLGVHILGSDASELILSAATMLADEFRVQDIQQMIFPHPTVAEVLKDTLYE